MPRADADRHYDETRRIAEALGALDVPRSEDDVGVYFTAVQPRLAFTERSHTVLQILQHIRLPVPLPGLSRDVFLGAGMALLPEWAIDRLQPSRTQRLRARTASATLRMLAPLFRAALKDGPAQRACRRVGKTRRATAVYPRRRSVCQGALKTDIAASV